MITRALPHVRVCALVQSASGLHLSTAPIGEGDDPEQQPHTNGTATDATPGRFFLR